MNNSLNLLSDRKGQYFITAAIIIIVVIVSFVAVSNFTQKRDTERLVDLGKEITLESQQTIEYGTYSQLDETQMKILMESFIQIYADRIGNTGNLYFAYGNSNKIFTVAYMEAEEEEAYAILNPYGPNDNDGCAVVQPHQLEVTQLETGTPHSQEFQAEGNPIKRFQFDIAGIKYSFKLKEGENFYFIIWQQVNKDRILITSCDLPDANCEEDEIPVCNS